VLYAVKDLIGEQALNNALREFARERGGPRGYPTTAQLIAKLPRHPLIEEWMNDVVSYDMKVESANARRLPDGRYEVKMRVSAMKQREGGPKLPLAESIDVGVFSGEELFHVAKHPLHDGVNDISVIVAKEPSYAAVDPYVTRIDRNRFDNGRDIQ
jgi:hypothetical protein